MKADHPLPIDPSAPRPLDNDDTARPAPGRWHRLRRKLARVLVQVRRRVPFGLRSLLGLLLVVGGIFGFLPVLGFWMIPLGIAVIGLDVAQLSRMLRGRR